MDTNVVLSVLVDRNAEQQARAAELFAAAAAGDLRIVLHQVAINESVHVMENVYEVKPVAVAAILRDLLALPGVVTIDELDWPTVLSLWPRRITDFGDACLAAVAKSDAFDALATFDAGFRKQLRRQGLATHW
ncbi:MAG: PIN domain-containing protein [Acidobacteria bacterium]|nr:PIN domain-containing protein [Acidobacteriota bacterium]